MSKLINYTKILRSKNAGPLYLTMDIIFNSKEDMDKVKDSITAYKIAKLYDVKISDVSIIPYEIVNSIKVTIPRKYISGSIYDTDIYGCQQHMALAEMEVWHD